MSDEERRGLAFGLTVLALATVQLGVIYVASEVECGPRCQQQRDSIAALQERLQEERAREATLRARADSLTDAYRGVPRWAR